MQKYAPQGIVAQQFSHREIQNAKPGDIVGLVGSMEVDSVNFLGAPIGQIATISQDRKSFVVVELFASMIVEQVAGTGGVAAGDSVKTSQNAGAAALLTTLATDNATLTTALAAQATAQSAYNAAQAVAVANPTNSGDATAAAAALATLNTAINTTAAAQAAVNSVLAQIAALGTEENVVVTAAPGTTATDVPLVWGRALNTVAAGATVFVLPV